MPRFAGLLWLIALMTAGFPAVADHTPPAGEISAAMQGRLSPDGLARNVRITAVGAAICRQDGGCRESDCKPSVQCHYCPFICGETPQAIVQQASLLREVSHPAVTSFVIPIDYPPPRPAYHL